MSIKIAQATPGRKVVIPSFEGVITNVEDRLADYCVEITAADGTVSYIFESKLNAVLPYTDGLVYAANGGNGGLYVYVAGPDGSEGTWRNYRANGEQGTERGFSYPDRPMVQAILGDSLND